MTKLASTTNSINLIFTPQALFPNIPNPSLDPKCAVIAKVAEVWVTKFLAAGGESEQRQLVQDAEQRYSLLSEGMRLPFSEARQRVSAFVGAGVSFEVAKEYFGYLLSPVYEDEWRNFKV